MRLFVVEFAVIALIEGDVFIVGPPYAKRDRLVIALIALQFVDTIRQRHASPPRFKRFNPFSQVDQFIKCRAMP